VFTYGAVSKKRSKKREYGPLGRPDYFVGEEEVFEC
jgi:hypothetical protein